MDMANNSKIRTAPGSRLGLADSPVDAQAVSKTFHQLAVGWDSQLLGQSIVD
jgi:hypothetical protein